MADESTSRMRCDEVGDTADAIAARLEMKPIPHEGPLFAPVYRGPVSSGATPLDRDEAASYSAIYTLITPERFSAMHRLAKDELWHFHAGGPLELLLLFPDGRSDVVVLGPDLTRRHHPLFRVPRGVWQGARLFDASIRDYALVGNTVCPAFEYSDYEPGFREELIARYPARAAQITALTRTDSIRR